jgi:CRISPR-associated protein (TIGR03986 family)
MMFRFPYPCSPAELAAEHGFEEENDFAQALFGKVANDNGCATSLKSRVYFGDLKCSSNDRLENELIPPILASPKPTTFQHYLEQQGQKANNKYSGNSKLRGHKLYWHREKEKCNENCSDIAMLRQNPDSDKQHTIIQPVKKETLFKGKIKFFNLTKIELGCLLDSLLLPKGCYHKIGMAKPLGFGSLQIQKSLKLQLFDPDANYAAWQNEPTKSHDDIDSFRKAFEEYIIDFAKSNDVAIDKKQHGLRQLSRINELFTILNYNKKPANLKTRYMTIEQGDIAYFGNRNEFKFRPILPKPSKV